MTELKLKNCLQIGMLLFLFSCTNQNTNNTDNTPLSNLKNTFNVKNSSAELTLKEDDFDADFRGKFLSSIAEIDSKQFILGETNISKQGKDTTVNLGLINRTLSKDNGYLLGFNLFYDHEFPRNHQRASIGVEAMSNVGISVATNKYKALSADKVKNNLTERAMNGTDLTLSFPAPYMPSSKIKLHTYKWDGTAFDINNGKMLSVVTDLSETVKFEIGMEDNDRLTSSRWIGTLSYKISNDKYTKKRKPIFSDKAFSQNIEIDLDQNVYSFAERNNRIVKTVSGSVIIGRGT